MGLQLKRTRGAAALLVVLAVTMAGCQSATEAGEHADEVAKIQLTVGNQVVTMVAGNPPATAIVIARGNTPVGARFIAADGDEIELSADEFHLEVELGNPALLTFARTSAFAGTLNGLAAGSTSMKVQLIHIAEDHPDFEVRNIPVTVQ